jgi:hypothetical protein
MINHWGMDRYRSAIQEEAMYTVDIDDWAARHLVPSVGSIEPDWSIYGNRPTPADYQKADKGW